MDPAYTIASLKKIAGDVLLLLYSFQRKQGYCSDDVLSFDRKMILREGLGHSELGKAIFEVAHQSIVEAYNALRYLQEKRFLYFREHADNMTYHLIDMRVTAEGIDIIEGVERGESERRDFHVTFNIKLADNVSIESLIKGEIGSLIKASVI